MMTQPSFLHTRLAWRLSERLDTALDYVNALPPQDVLLCDTECLTKIVKQFAVAPPIVRSDLRAADERIVETVDETFVRKTGNSGHSFFMPIEGEPDWLEEIDSQRTEVDDYPLAFLDKKRSWVYIKLTVSPEDQEGTLKRNLDQRVSLCCAVR